MQFVTSGGWRDGWVFTLSALFGENTSRCFATLKTFIHIGAFRFWDQIAEENKCRIRSWRMAGVKIFCTDRCIPTRSRVKMAATPEENLGRKKKSFRRQLLNPRAPYFETSSSLHQKYVWSETCCVLGGENVDEGGLDDGPEGDGPDSVGCEEDQDILDCSDQIIEDISLKYIVRFYLRPTQVFQDLVWTRSVWQWLCPATNLKVFIWIFLIICPHILLLCIQSYW